MFGLVLSLSKDGRHPPAVVRQAHHGVSRVAGSGEFRDDIVITTTIIIMETSPPPSWKRTSPPFTTMVTYPRLARRW
jgi:hypothetical protein